MHLSSSGSLDYFHLVAPPCSRASLKSVSRRLKEKAWWILPGGFQRLGPRTAHTTSAYPASATSQSQSHRLATQEADVDTRFESTWSLPGINTYERKGGNNLAEVKLWHSPDKAMADPVGSSGANIAYQKCPRLGQNGCASRSHQRQPLEGCAMGQGGWSSTAEVNLTELTARHCLPTTFPAAGEQDFLEEGSGGIPAGLQCMATKESENVIQLCA